MTRLMVMIGFLVAFGAGLVVGTRMQPAPPAAAGPATRPSRDSWLTAELNLTAEQQEQLRQIWSETAGGGRRQLDEQRRQFRQERDRAIAALIGPEQKPQYEQIMKEHAERNNELDRQWRSAYQNAVERTRQILTPQQQARYEELLRRHDGERGGRDDRETREQTRRGGERATTRPAPNRESPSR